MMRKTEDQVRDEVAALKKLLAEKPVGYMDGITIALRVLENWMGNDEVFDEFEREDCFDDAHSAMLWRDGRGGDAPSVQYREML